MAITPFRTQWHLNTPAVEAVRRLLDAGYTLVGQNDDGTRHLEREFGNKIASRLLGEYFVPKSMPGGIAPSSSNGGSSPRHQRRSNLANWPPPAIT